VRILWHSASPWHATGYGTQTAIWCRRLAAAGHDVFISSYVGLSGQDMEWEGIPVFAAPFFAQAIPISIRRNIEKVKPDLVIGLYDPWRMPNWPFEGWRTAHWTPIDTDPVSVGDAEFFYSSKVRAIAMSRAGQGALEHAGIPSVLVEHGIDTTLYRPFGESERATARAWLGLQPGEFAVGINASNTDPYRKALPEQFQAFARFHAKHPAARLYINSCAQQENSLDLGALLKVIGLRVGPGEPVRISDQPVMYTGGMPVDQMVAWYNGMDVVMNASRGEGFGLTGLEAQACGTPVILADNTSGPELVGPGWLARCQPFWNMTHMAWWGTPRLDDLARCLEKAFQYAPRKRDAARQHALKWDVERIWPAWESALTELMAD
jgi:glycosyltransferase involved in cell wall biosynthesis